MENQSSRRHLDERGSVILFALIGIGVVATMALAYASSYTSVRRAQSKLNLLNFVSELQLSLRNTVNDPQSWNATIADYLHNSAMGCIALQSCTTSVAPTAFTLWPAGVTSYSSVVHSTYDGTNPTAGFTLDGTPCTTFTLSGNSACPLHVNLSWSTPGCAAAPCQATIFVQADVLFRPGRGFSSFSKINEAGLSLLFTQVLAGSTTSCAGSPPLIEQAACATPTYPIDQLFCTGSGWRCGQIYF